jgi:hypothetical protein
VIAREGAKSTCVVVAGKATVERRECRGEGAGVMSIHRDGDQRRSKDADRLEDLDDQHAGSAMRIGIVEVL